MEGRGTGKVSIIKKESGREINVNRAVDVEGAIRERERKRERERHRQTEVKGER